MVLLATCIGLTLTLLIQSPWGKRSGAHMNPAITLAFLRLKKIHPWDAVFYIFAQAVGGIVGVLLTAAVLGSVFKDPPIHYAATVPGAAGEATAFVAESIDLFCFDGNNPGFCVVTSPRAFYGPGDWRPCSCLDRRRSTAVRHEHESRPITRVCGTRGNVAASLDLSPGSKPGDADCRRGF